MFKVVSIEQIRQIEADADAAGHSYDQMIQDAGRAAANRALAIIEGIEQPRVTVLVGAGNNGADGLVTGLFIAQDNPDADVRFYLLKERDDDYANIAEQAGLFIVMAEGDHDKRLLRNMVASADLVIDALFGISVRLPIKDEAGRILQQTNRAINERRRARPDVYTVDPARGGQIPQAPPVYVLAIDCPSGLDCDTGALDANAIPAHETITFIAAKHGHFLFPGAEAVGQLALANIGTPAKVQSLKDAPDSVVSSDVVKALLPDRGLNSHKGTYGKTLIIGGSTNYVGAVGLAADAAYRSGVGLVSVGTPAPVMMALAGAYREPTWLMLPHDMGVIAEGALKMVRDELATYNALLVGPGMNTEKTTGEFLIALLEQSGETPAKPAKRSLGFQIEEAASKAADEDEKLTLPALVVDADGLNLLAEIDNWWEKLPADTIITPHPGEMARLAKLETQDVQSNRLALAREKAQAWGVILVLKGAHTLIASPDGKVAILPFKNDALATAGTGDVLAGLLAGWLAQGMKPLDAAMVGAYVHGLAGEHARQHQSSRSVMAGDVLSAIGLALAEIEG